MASTPARLQRPSLTCPLSLLSVQSMQAPCTTASPGGRPAGLHVYEYDEIVRWVREQGTCPLTRAPLDVADLVRIPCILTFAKDWDAFHDAVVDQKDQVIVDLLDLLAWTTGGQIAELQRKIQELEEEQSMTRRELCTALQARDEMAKKMAALRLDIAEKEAKLKNEADAIQQERTQLMEEEELLTNKKHAYNHELSQMAANIDFLRFDLLRRQEFLNFLRMNTPAAETSTPPTPAFDVDGVVHRTEGSPPKRRRVVHL